MGNERESIRRNIPEITNEDEKIQWLETESSQEGKEKRRRFFKRKSMEKRLVHFGVVLCVLVALYLTVVYSTIPFIDKWRTIYIETAMTTNSHQWLATWFFPQSVIDEVMERYRKNLESQKDLSSTWEDETESAEDKTRDFFDKYWELDSASFHAYVKQHPYIEANGYESIQIENLDKHLDIQTVRGDDLLVLDTANNLMIVGVSKDAYQGKLAIVKNPKQVELAKADTFGTRGQEAETYGNKEDVLLVINANGFKDVGGHGSGGEVKGSVLIDGVEYSSHISDSTWKFCGMSKENRMYIRDYPFDSVNEYRWGVEFLPALVLDGESVVDGTFGMGIQPRTAIGQTAGGDMLLLIIDGRQVGYSLGCTVEECKNILMDYKAYQAMNMDGGSSSVMWYNGEYITRSSSVSGKGRFMPDAFVVKKAKKSE